MNACTCQNLAVLRRPFQPVCPRQRPPLSTVAPVALFLTRPGLTKPVIGQTVNTP